MNNADLSKWLSTLMLRTAMASSEKMSYPQIKSHKYCCEVNILLGYNKVVTEKGSL